ncbi:MAG: calcium-binding protein [Saprospiraceae bacterium]|nr:calcium-binding protein [Saprospiraceae bacterium]
MNWLDNYHEIMFADAKDDEDVAMGWFYYMSDYMEFPIKATAKLRLRGGKTETIAVEIVEVDANESRDLSIRLGIVEKGNQPVQYVSPETITQIDSTANNLEILNDWLYWHDFPLLAG